MVNAAVALTKRLLSLCFLVAVLFALAELPASAVVEMSLSEEASQSFQQGIENIKSDNYQQALSDFTRALAKDDRLAGAAYSNLCLVHLQLGHNRAASNDCTAALQLNPDNIEAYLNLGLAYYRIGDYLSALEQYDNAIFRDSEDYRVYYNRGLAYLAHRDNEKALGDFNLALASSGTIPESQKALIYSDRGLANLMTGDLRAAIDDLTQAISLDSSNEQTYYNRACSYHRNGNTLAAIDDFTQVLKLNPTSAEAYTNRGWLRHELGFEKAALEDLNTALKYFDEQGKTVAYHQTQSLIERLQRVLPTQRYRKGLLT